MLITTWWVCNRFNVAVGIPIFQCFGQWRMRRCYSRLVFYPLVESENESRSISMRHWVSDWVTSFQRFGLGIRLIPKWMFNRKFFSVEVDTQSRQTVKRRSERSSVVYATQVSMIFSRKGSSRGQLRANWNKLLKCWWEGSSLWEANLCFSQLNIPPGTWPQHHRNKLYWWPREIALGHYRNRTESYRIYLKKPSDSHSIRY